MNYSHSQGLHIPSKKKTYGLVVVIMAMGFAANAAFIGTMTGSRFTANKDVVSSSLAPNSYQLSTFPTIKIVEASSYPTTDKKQPKLKVLSAPVGPMPSLTHATPKPLQESNSNPQVATPSLTSSPSENKKFINKSKDDKAKKKLRKN
jgi:hypothetical protein